MRALAIRLQYLTGRCVATAYNDRERAEWPPHPARLYSALVAAWAESETRDESERTALEWLAELDPPGVHAPNASHRQVVPHFVPVNDTSVLKNVDGKQEKLAELEQALEAAKADFEDAQRSADSKRAQKAQKALAKAETALGKERRKLQELIAADHAPYAPGKHPDAALKSAWALIPEHRGKQPRNFPSVSLDTPFVYLRWTGPAEAVQRYAPALAALATRVASVGHSSSLVSCSVVDHCPAPNWEPHDEGDEVLRVPGPAQFTRLEEAFELHQGVEPRVLPCRFQRYARQGNATTGEPAVSVFADDWVVFRQTSGRRLSQTSCVEFARAMRGALLKHSDDPPPQLLSGHAQNGEPATTPHLAVVPLPFVGHPHASGDVLGLALVFPRESSELERRAVLRAIGVWEEQRRSEIDDALVDTPPLELRLGRAGVIEIERIEWGVAPLKTLRTKAWCRTSRAWVTATPIALDRNPGNLYSRDPAEAQAAYAAAERSIAAACEHIGLPTPQYVQVHPSVPVNGAVKTRAYPPFPADPKKLQRVKVHARIEFPVPVAGPVLLGAGRYYGLGLCLPQPHEEAILQ